MCESFPFILSNWFKTNLNNLVYLSVGLSVIVAIRLFWWELIILF